MSLTTCLPSDTTIALVVLLLTFSWIAFLLFYPLILPTNAPPLVDYTLPWLGHVFSLLSSPSDFMRECRYV